MKFITLYADDLKGKTKVWSCGIMSDGITVVAKWGTVGGKIQLTRDVIKADSRSSAKERAIEEFERRVTRKKRAGYVERKSETTAVQATTKLQLDFNRLPRTFAPAKPIREIDPDEAARLETAGLLVVQRKRDGMRHYIVSGDDGQVRVFSRGLDDMTQHFTRLTQELSLPPRTLLDAEFVVETDEGRDDFIAVSGICRSKPDRAHQMMVHNELGGKDLSLLVFDILYLQGKPMWTATYKTRYALLRGVLDQAHEKGRTQFNHVRAMPVLTCGLRKAVDRVEKHSWEGLVLWRADQPTQVRMNRSPARCNCYKLKPMKEDDFIATGFELGKGKNSKVVGALNIARRDGKRFIAVGNVGTGLDDATRKSALTWVYPCVVQVQYERMSETGLRFPAFIRKREDKRPSEC